MGRRSASDLFELAQEFQRGQREPRAPSRVLNSGPTSDSRLSMAKPAPVSWRTAESATTASYGPQGRQER